MSSRNVPVSMLPFSMKQVPPNILTSVTARPASALRKRSTGSALSFAA
jgi:hypothetical protein